MRKVALRAVNDAIQVDGLAEAGQTFTLEELLKDVDRQLRELDAEIDRCETRRKLFLALRSYLAGRVAGTLKP